MAEASMQRVPRGEAGREATYFSPQLPDCAASESYKNGGWEVFVENMGHQTHSGINRK